jgi:Na+-driven multidrug efflux pump
MSPALSLTTDPIATLTWRIALPMSIGMFFHTMFNVVDTLCAGWLGTEALAALSLSFPLFFMVIAIGSGLSQGTTALLANALGAGDPPRPDAFLHNPWSSPFSQACSDQSAAGSLRHGSLRGSAPRAAISTRCSLT